MCGRATGGSRAGSVDSVHDVSETNVPLTILTVHAHPDDEASKGAPTLAKYKAEGARTILVCCTGGEEGDLQNPSLREAGQPFHGLAPEQERELVASLRAPELAASAEVIGFDEVVMLGYRDSGMADTEPNANPDCFHQADLDEAVGRLVAIIRRTKSQVIITYGDDQAGYPHPDHLRVHDISVLAFDRAGDPEWYPDLGAPFQPSKLYYAVWAKARILAVHEAMLKYTGESPFSDEWLEREGQDHRITTKVEVGGLPVGAHRRAACACHAGRPERRLVVRADRRAARRDLPVGGLDPRSQRGRSDPGLRHRTRPVRRNPRDCQRMKVQYKVVVAKKDERVDGPDDADIVITVPIVDAAADGFDPAVAFMRGKLKAAGDSGEILDLLKSGAPANAIAALVATA